MFKARTDHSSVCRAAGMEYLLAYATKCSNDSALPFQAAAWKAVLAYLGSSQASVVVSSPLENSSQFLLIIIPKRVTVISLETTQQIGRTKEVQHEGQHVHGIL